MMRTPFEVGVLHYDAPPPAQLPSSSDLADLAADDVFRFAHRLAARIEVKNDRIVSAGYEPDSAGAMGGTTVGLGGWATRLSGVAMPLLREVPVIEGDSATFMQTFGGRTGLPAPRRVTDRPIARWKAPLVWTTLRLTIHADGRANSELVGASGFPRHWVYETAGRIASKSAVTAFNDWYHGSHGIHTPWGAENREVLTVESESELERQLASSIMRGGAKPDVLSLASGEVMIAQGSGAGPIYLVLDGVLAVEVDGRKVGEIGPGAIVGERAHLEAGRTTATLRAKTGVRFAQTDASQIDPVYLAGLAQGHQREYGGSDA
jgi:hypothetical protein